MKKVFTVFDSKAGVFMQPFYAVSSGVAERQFLAAVMDSEHEFHRFAEDYTLFELAKYDEESGKFENLESPRSLLNAAVAKALRRS